METDAAILRDLGERLARHRLNKNLTQDALAREAGVSKRTLIRMEGGESTQLTNLVRVLRALGLASGLTAIAPFPKASPIAALESRRASEKAERRRASSASEAPGESSGEPRRWSWGDEHRSAP